MIRNYPFIKIWKLENIKLIDFIKGYKYYKIISIVIRNFRKKLFVEKNNSFLYFKLEI